MIGLIYYQNDFEMQLYKKDAYKFLKNLLAFLKKEAIIKIGIIPIIEYGGKEHGRTKRK